MIDYKANSIIPKDDLSLPYIWVSLHLNAQIEQDTLANPRLSRETARMSGEITYLLQALQNVPAQNWWNICEASGWTVYGAVGLSWCDGATSELFWRAWALTKFPLAPGQATERPCHFINPDILPKSTRLTDIVTDCANVSDPICVSIAALRETLIVDISQAQIDQAEPQVRAFLNARMDTTPEPQKDWHNA